MSYKDHITNEQVLKTVNEKRSLLENIKCRKCAYFGHVIRGNGLQRALLEGKVDGTRKRGRPRRTWSSDVLEWLKIRYPTATRAALHRQQWHAMVAQVQQDMAPV